MTPKHVTIGKFHLHEKHIAAYDGLDIITKNGMRIKRVKTNGGRQARDHGLRDKIEVQS